MIPPEAADPSLAIVWSNQYLAHGFIHERQSGYHPEIGSCGSGTTCNDACGDTFITCPANTSLALFCYDPTAGQTCCNNGDGRACDSGYYCARDLSDATWCCEDQYNVAECASLYQLPTLITGIPMPPSTTSQIFVSTGSTTSLTTKPMTASTMFPSAWASGSSNRTNATMPPIIPYGGAVSLRVVWSIVILGLLPSVLLH